MNYQVINLTPELLPQIEEINQLTGAGSWNTSQFLYELSSGDSIHIGVIDKESEDGLLLAFLFARPITIKHLPKDPQTFPSESETEIEIEIFLIGTSPDHQRKGLARLLLDKLLILLNNNGEVFLEVRKGNRKAIDFYLNNGFQPVGERPNYYQNPSEGAILMKLAKIDKI